MEYFIGILGFLSIFVVFRMILGPTVWDRLLAFNQLSSKIMVGIVFLSLFTEQSFLLDIAIVYTLFSFVGSVMIARFLKSKGDI